MTPRCAARMRPGTLVRLSRYGASRGYVLGCTLSACFILWESEAIVLHLLWEMGHIERVRQHDASANSQAS